MDSHSKATTGNVMVVCRVRPLNQKEIAKGSKCCLDFFPDKKTISIAMSGDTSSGFGTNKFAFDSVFDVSS